MKSLIITFVISSLIAFSATSQINEPAPIIFIFEDGKVKITRAEEKIMEEKIQDLLNILQEEKFKFEINLFCKYSADKKECMGTYLKRVSFCINFLAENFDTYLQDTKISIDFIEINYPVDRYIEEGIYFEPIITSFND